MNVLDLPAFLDDALANRFLVRVRLASGECKRLLIQDWDREPRPNKAFWLNGFPIPDGEITHGRTKAIDLWISACDSLELDEQIDPHTWHKIYIGQSREFETSPMNGPHSY